MQRMSVLVIFSRKVTKMMYKIALVAALCVAQGFAHKPHDKTPAFNDDENVAEDFEEAIHEMDEVTEAVSMAAMEAYFKDRDPDVIVECFREEKDNFAALGQKMNKKMEEAHREMAELLGDKFEPYSKRFAVPMRAIGEAVKTYPVIIWSYMKEKEFSKAFEATGEFRRIVQINSRIMGSIKREMAREFPECAQRAEELCREIRQEVRMGCGAIRGNIRRCIEAGGPNKPDQDDTEAQVEEAPKQ